MSKLKWILLLVLLSIGGFVYLQELPVKQAVKASFDSISKEEIPLGDVEIICEHSDTSGADWKILGYDNHLFPSANGYMYVEGVNPLNELTEYITIHDSTSGKQKNRFIIKGVLEKRGGASYNEQDGNLVLVSKEWDIVYPIKRNDLFRVFASKSHLSKWDYKSSK